MIPFCYFLHYTPHQKAILISELRKDERKHEGNKNMRSKNVYIA